MDDGASPMDDLKNEIEVLNARLERLEQEVWSLRAAKKQSEAAGETAKSTRPITPSSTDPRLPALDANLLAPQPNIPPSAPDGTNAGAPARTPGTGDTHVPVDQKPWQGVEPIVIKQSPGARQTPHNIPPPPPPPQSSDSVEQFFGRNLRKFAILFIVLGCASGILYSFQYFNAMMKLTCGVIVSATMIGAGAWLDKKESTGQKWYGRELIGGGWALLYFTTYAAHNFDSVRLIDDSLTDLLLLMVIAACAVARSLKFKSEAFTGFTLLLGLITISVSDVTGFTLLAVVLLALALAFLVVRMRWYELFVYGITIFYGIYVFCTLPQLKSETDMSDFVMTLFCSLFSWVVFNIAMFRLGFDEDEHHHKVLAGTTLINCAAFVLAVSGQMPTQLEDWRPAMLTCLGVSYAGLAYFANAKKLFMLRSANIYLALLLCTVALLSKVHGATLSLATLMEVPALVAFGLHYKLLPPRKFAVVLALYNIVAVWGFLFFRNDFAEGNPENIMLALTGICCFAGSAAMYKWPMMLQGAGVRNEDPFHFYVIVSALMIAVTTQENIISDYLALAFAIEAVVFVHIGFRLKDRPLRVLGGLSVCVMAFVELLLTVGTWRLWPTLLVVAILYYLGALYRKPEYKEMVWVGIMYRIAATICLTALFGQVFPAGWLSVAWAVEGLLLLLCGFQFSDKIMRVMGLSVLSLTIIKLLLIDLAFAETIYRILSLIIAGLVLLASSFAYLKLAKPVADSGGPQAATEKPATATGEPASASTEKAAAIEDAATAIGDPATAIEGQPVPTEEPPAATGDSRAATDQPSKPDAVS